MAFTTNDNAPYLYRKSGGGGDLEIDELVGGTIAWNQIIADTFSVDGTHEGVTYTRNADGSITVSGTVSEYGSSYRQIWNNTNITVGHKYYATTGLANSTCFLWYNGGGGFDTSGGRKVGIITTLANGFYIRCNRAGTTVNETLRPQVFDLTLMFGSTIADYVYSLEQSSQGSGLAWLRSYGFFTEDYYDYNSGELKSVSNLVSHDMTGKNLVNVNSSGITGAYIDANGETHTSNAWSVSDFVPVMSGENYILSGLTSHPNTGVDNFILYDGGKNKVGNITQSALTSFTIPSGVSYVKFSWKNTEKDTVMFEQGSTAASYEPYTLHSYPLGDVTLRGLPKLNGNALYYDGDTYESNGTVTRKYGVVDLGTQTWYSISGGRVKTNATIATSAKPANTARANIIATNYVNAESNSALANDTSLLGYIAIATDGGAVVRLRDGETTPTGYLVYELATPTTETADTYTNPQWVDPNGTEKYTLSSNAFPMPVGHETTYNTDMGSKTVNTQVNLSMTEPQVRQVYAKEGDTARVLNIHLDQTEEDGTLRILRPDGTEVTADAVLVPEFYDGLMAEIPSDATSVVGKCYCDVEQNGVSSMPFTLNVKKNERQ